MHDRHGNELAIGDRVRVLEIDRDFLDALPDDERPHIEAMLNNEFAIDAFPEAGKASVSICMDEGNGHFFIGGLHLLSHEFELVRQQRPLARPPDDENRNP